MHREKEKANRKEVNRLSVFRKIYPFIREERRQYILLGGLKLWSLLLTLIDPMLYMILINEVMIGGRLSLLPWVIAGYFTTYLLQTLGVVISKRMYSKVFLKFNLRIKTGILSIFTKMDVRTYEEYRTGDLKNRIDADVGVLEKFFTTHIMNYCYEIASGIMIGVILLSMNWILALTSFIMVPVSFWFVKVMGRRAREVSEGQRELQGKYESYLHESFRSWKQIKSNCLEEGREEILQEYHAGLSRLFIKNQIYWYINRAFISFKDFFITRMNLYFIGGLLIISGRMDVGLLLAFMNYYAGFFANISAVTDAHLELKNDEPAILRVLDIMRAQVDDRPGVTGLGGGITLEDVSFRYYENQPLVLQDVSLTVKPGEHIGIVGRSGCGKSSLAKLMTGVYAPLSGRVMIGGVESPDVDISYINMESVGRKVGIVAQSPALFNLSIRENLLFAKGRAEEGELVSVCQKANIYDFIEGLPKGFDTVIGERGIKLSGGQKQRLAIARTFLQNPDIIIFDEATSSLDSENERAVVEAVNELSRGKTVITIAHRLSAILGCDRVAVMDRGRIVAVDTNENLRGNNEVYDLLFTGQYHTV